MTSAVLTLPQIDRIHDLLVNDDIATLDDEFGSTMMLNEPAPIEMYSPERMAAIARKESEDMVYRHQAGLLLDILQANRKSLRPLELATLTTGLLSRHDRAHDRGAISQCMVNILLRSDDIELCSICFSPQDFNAWVMGNTEYAFAFCPKTVQAWIAGGSLGSTLVLSNIARACEGAEESHKENILNGKSSNQLHRMVPLLLGQGLAPWSTLSPAWIGKTNSPLRERAMALGWEPKLLMGMLFSSIWQHPEAWLINVAYPYSIVVCKWIIDAIRNGPPKPDPDGYFITDLSVSKKACPRDAALASALLLNSPVPVGYTLAVHPKLASVDAKTQSMILTVVHLRATHQGMPGLAQDICEGIVLSGNTEVFGIDGLV